MFDGAFHGRRVLVTGHTGFKGSWLTTWLLELGAEVTGYSRDVPTDPSNFEVLGLENRIEHHIGDVRDLAALREVFDISNPEVVFHLAAQSLVRRSYDEPLETFETNAMGTARVLEAVRSHQDVEAAVFITSDKCYRNVEWVWGYREDDTLGGGDPYSGSKAAAEMVFYSYLQSYFNDPAGTRIASARAGNVIGGGDWAADRLVPDCVGSWSKGDPVVLRSPDATRPWQHVLEPLSGYLWLAANLLGGGAGAGESYNFGPAASVDESVAELVHHMGRSWPAARAEVDASGVGARPEARLLKLSCDKALAELSWEATLGFTDTVRMTSEWYRTYYEEGPAAVPNVTGRQIDEYCRAAKARGIQWAIP